MRGWQAAAGEHGDLGLPRGLRALAQDAGEKAVKAFVIARSHGVMRGADIEMVHTQMFGPEMGIEHRGEQKVTHPAFHSVFLVHQFMGINDADGAADDTHAKEQDDGFGGAQMGGAGDIVEQPDQQGALDGKPQNGDGAVPEQPSLGGGGVGVIGILAGQGIENGEQDP